MWPAQVSGDVAERRTIVQLMASRGKLVLPPIYSRRILMASTLMCTSVASALYNRLPDNAMLAVLVLCSSVNYWRHPVLGARRYFDMVCAIGSLAYQCFYTSQRTSKPARHAYWMTVAAGGSCYLVGRYFSFSRRMYNVSSSLHVCLHVFGNVGNLLLYDSLGVNLLRLG